MIVRIVKLEFKGEHVAEFFQVFESIKLKVVNFPGCESMQLLQSKEDPSIFFTYSLWEDENALEAYRLSETFQGLWSTIKPWFAQRASAWTLSSQFSGKNESF